MKGIIALVLLIAVVGMSNAQWYGPPVEGPFPVFKSSFSEYNGPSYDNGASYYSYYYPYSGQSSYYSYYNGGYYYPWGGYGQYENGGGWPYY